MYLRAIICISIDSCPSSIGVFFSDDFEKSKQRIFSATQSLYILHVERVELGQILHLSQKGESIFSIRCSRVLTLIEPVQLFLLISIC